MQARRLASLKHLRIATGDHSLPTKKKLNTTNRLALLAAGFIALTQAPLAHTDSAPNLSDQLMAELLHRHTDGMLYQQADNPWPGGTYKLQVFKNGKPRVLSSMGSVEVHVPLRVAIAGTAASDLLKIKMGCTASFTTLGRVEFTPRQAGIVEVLKSTITLPIPAVVADCDGVKLPIDSYLTVAVEQNKQQWQADVDQKVNGWLKKDALPPAK